MRDQAAQPTILIVDDDRGLSRLIEKTLQREGFKTATAASGGDAAAWLKTHRADLLLVDLKLQDMEGKELIAHLAEAKRPAPFLVITGQGDERAAVEMMKRGALDYLVKDVQFQEFLPTVVRRALDRLDKEKRLAEAEAALKQAQKEILEISRREQLRIGQDLHDGLGQQLAGVELMCEVLQQKLAAKSKSEAERAGEIARHVRDAIAHTRNLARGLSPVQLDAGGLMSALQELAASVEAMSGVQCRFQCDEPILIHDNTAATHLYRIAQEAINNAIKHGKPKKILVTFQPVGDRHCLLVSNDGAAFPADARQSRGLGLRIMNYRAGEIGATLQIQSESGKGATVRCLFNKDL